VWSVFFSLHVAVCAAAAAVPAAGIPEGAAFVHVMYVYRDPSDSVPYDDSIEVNFKLPVRDED
jgi:hypothetical protein